MRTSEIMEMSGDHDHSFAPINKKRKSHVVTPGYSVLDELQKVVMHVKETPHISKENRKKIAMMAQNIIDTLKHEN